MAEIQPLINPTLRLLIEPAREGVEGRGKGERTIKRGRLGRQRRQLANAVEALAGEMKTRRKYAGKTLIVAEMFAEDSLAPTHTPTDLFARSIGCELIAPLGDGYLVEIGVSDIPKLRARIDSSSLTVSSDVSRVKSIYRFSRRRVLKGRSVNSLWDKAAEDDQGKYFLLWLQRHF